MRVTHFQVYEIIGSDMHMDDIVDCAFTLFKADNPQIEIADVPKDHEDKLSSDMHSALKVLNAFSGDNIKYLPDFRKYMILVNAKICERAQMGSIRYHSQQVMERLVQIIDKIISGEWTWK